MSKAEKPVTLNIFRTVLDSVAYIPTKSVSEIAKGINHAVRITIDPVSFSRNDIVFKRIKDSVITIPSQGAKICDWRVKKAPEECHVHPRVTLP